MSAPISGAELLKRIQPKLPEEFVEICLRPDLVEAFHEANDALQEAVANGMKGARVNSKPKAQTEAAEMVRAIEEEIEANSATFRFRGLPKDEWRALCDNHPPRKGNELDQYVGYDRDAVLDDAVRASLIDPVFDDESWAELVKVISSGEWDELRTATNQANRSVVESPKSVLASQILTKHGTDSQ